MTSEKIKVYPHVEKLPDGSWRAALHLDGFKNEAAAMGVAVKCNKVIRDDMDKFLIQEKIYNA